MNVKKICSTLLFINLTVLPTFRGIMLDKARWKTSMSDEQAYEFGYPLGKNTTEPQELVLIQSHNCQFKFAKILPQEINFGTTHGFLVETATEKQRFVPDTQILKLKPLWQCLFQPNVSLEHFKTILNEYKKNIPQKIHMTIESVEPNSHFIVIGDIHGNFWTLQNILEYLYNALGIIDEDLKLQDGYSIICTGDYVDRGTESVEVLYTLMKLGLVNPESILLRGNHEAFDIAKDFLREWRNKFSDNIESRKTAEDILNLFTHLPHASVLGLPSPSSDHVTFIHLSHGGMNPIKNILKKHLQSKKKKSYYAINWTHNYLWDDYHSNKSADGTPYVEVSPRGFGCRTISYAAVIKALKESDSTTSRPSFNLLALFRGHQHQDDGITILSEYPFGNRDWSPLANENHAIKNEAVITLTATPHAHKYTSAFGILHAGTDGIWYFKPETQP